MDKPPYLTLVDNQSSSQSNDDEFIPLPAYPWDERPSTLPLDFDECATALHLAKGDKIHAAELLKIDPVRLKRFLRASPRLQRILDEASGINIDKAQSVIIRTLWDPNSNSRQLEWAATKLLQSRQAQGDPFSPAPAASIADTVADTGTIIFRWGDGRALGGEIKSSPLVEGENKGESSVD